MNNQSNMQSENPDKRNKNIWIIATIAIIAILVASNFVILFMFRQTVKEIKEQTAAQEQNTSLEEFKNTEEPEENQEINSQTQATSDGWETLSKESLGFTINYPSTWIVDDNSKNNLYGLSVNIRPTNGEAFAGYIGIGLDNRTIDSIRTINKEYSTESQIIIGGVNCYMFTANNSKNTKSIFVPYNDKFYLLGTDKYDLAEVREAINSFRLKKI